MAPNSPTGVLFEDEELNTTSLPDNSETVKTNKPLHPRQLVWRNVILMLYLHLAALYGIYLIFTSAKFLTTLFAFLLYEISSLGITAGAHRLWSHRTYKATWQLRLLLMLFNLVSFQNHIYEWARDHRVHHKYSETDADPHNAKRGFFFSHVGWLMVRKHPQVIAKGRQISLQDLHDDKIVMFQKKYYLLLMPLVCFVLPTITPPLLWGETWINSLFVATLFRYAFSLNVTWLVNSAAHMWGHRPYDTSINPAENLVVAFFAIGEGWHNYHHVFPWDYKTAELGNYRYNLTTAFIDFFKWVGWAYDLKTVPASVVEGRVRRTGDGSHELWGWGDQDMSVKDRQEALCIAPHKDQGQLD